MAKGKKATASSSYSKKKDILIPNKKSTKKPERKLDTKKVKIISQKLTKMNNNFESLIKECRKALTKITENNNTHITQF